MYDLCEHLIIEQEIVRIRFERQRLDNFSRVSAKAGVIFGQLEIQKDVLKKRKAAICHVLV